MSRQTCSRANEARGDNSAQQRSGSSGSPVAGESADTTRTGKDQAYVILAICLGLGVLLLFVWFITREKFSFGPFGIISFSAK